MLHASPPPCSQSPSCRLMYIILGQTTRSASSTPRGTPPPPSSPRGENGHMDVKTAPVSPTSQQASSSQRRGKTSSTPPRRDSGDGSGANVVTVFEVQTSAQTTPHDQNNSTTPSNSQRRSSSKRSKKSKAGKQGKSSLHALSSPPSCLLA